MDRTESAIDLLGRPETAVELAIGNRDEFAVTLAAEGVSVVATDIAPCETSDAIQFVRDDLRDPEMALYEAADVLYARRLPAELQAAAAALAERVACPLYFTTLGFEEPVIPVERIQTEATVWYRATSRG